MTKGKRAFTYPAFPHLELQIGYGGAKTLNVSRSRLFTLAASEFIQRHNNIALLKQINDAYEAASDPEQLVTMMHSNHYKMVKDQW